MTNSIWEFGLLDLDGSNEETKRSSQFDSRANNCSTMTTAADVEAIAGMLSPVFEKYKGQASYFGGT